MPATSQINACHSFIFEQPSEKCDSSKHVPRPPNAFMLYRSDFLKRGVIPREVEKRQQNLSRIAGQCWNMLPDTEKAVWFKKAAAIRAEHRVKYSFRHTGPPHKDTIRLPTKDKRSRSATKSGRSIGRLNTRRTRTLYCEGMFAALHDLIPPPESQTSTIPPTPAFKTLLSMTAPPSPRPLLSTFHDSKAAAPVSQASPIPLTPAFETPLSTTASLSPHSLPQSISPFTSHVHSSKQDLLLVTFDNPVIQKDSFGHPLDWPISEAKQLDLVQDSEIPPSEVDPTLQSHLILPSYRDGCTTGVPYLSLERLLEPQSDPTSQSPLTLQGKSLFPPATEHYFADFSFLDAFNVTDDISHFNPSLVPLYPWHSDGLDVSV